MKKVAKIILGVIAAFVIIGLLAGIFSGKKDGEKTKNASSGKDSANTAVANKPTEEEHWSYEEEVDKMTSKKMFFATTVSTNKVDFEFPYKGGSTFSLVVRNMSEKNEVVITVSKGQFMTSIMGNKAVKVKFDDKEPVNYVYSSASDGSSNVIFIQNSNKFLAGLKTAKKLMVEAEFFNAGNKIMEFDVAGLKWDK